MAGQQLWRQELWRNEELIQKTISAHGVDPNDVQAYNKLSPAKKDAMAADLAAASGVDLPYCGIRLDAWFAGKSSRAARPKDMDPVESVLAEINAIKSTRTTVELNGETDKPEKPARPKRRKRKTGKKGKG